MINSFYNDIDDPIFEQFIQQSPSQGFSYLREGRDYLLHTYSCNFTQFAKQCSFPEYLTIDFWESQRKQGTPVTQVIDDAFFEITLEKQRRHILNNRY